MEKNPITLRELIVSRNKYIDEINTHYKNEIGECTEGSEIFDDDFKTDITHRCKESHITLQATDSVSAAYDIDYFSQDEKTAVLNFASYKHPGGMFLEGSRAQEEALCESSILFPILKSFDDSYYYFNRHNGNNDSLYSNRAIYTPNVIFYPFDDSEFTCDVITCAAPNVGAYLRKKNASYDDEYDKIDEAIRSRIEFVLRIAADNKVDNLVLGAFGCGVFGCEPTHVAHAFALIILEKYNGVFKNIIFAIPDSTSRNYMSFKNTFENVKQVHNDFNFYEIQNNL